VPLLPLKRVELMIGPLGPLLQQVLQNADKLLHLIHMGHQLYGNWERDRERERELQAEAPYHAEIVRRYLEEQEKEQQRQAAEELRRREELRYQQETARLQGQPEAADRQFVRSVERAAAASGQSVGGFLARHGSRGVLLACWMAAASPREGRFQ
jgi:hypothetical protein